MREMGHFHVLVLRGTMKWRSAPLDCPEFHQEAAVISTRSANAR